MIKTMKRTKSSENIQKKEGGPDIFVSDNQSSLVTPNELAMILFPIYVISNYGFKCRKLVLIVPFSGHYLSYFLKNLNLQYLYFTALKPNLECIGLGFGALVNRPNNCLAAFQEKINSAMMNSTQMMGDIDKVANLLCRFVPFFYIHNIIILFNVRPLMTFSIIGRVLVH